MLELCETIESGNCLIASPMIPMDPHFDRTVILLTDHEEELGTSGLVLNRPVPEDHRAPMSTMICGSELRSHFLTGGPVGLDQAFCLIDTSLPPDSGLALPESRELLSGVQQPADFEETLESISSGILPEERVHFFRGYAGWEPGQLQSELSEQVWIMVRTPGDDLLSGSREDLWSRLLNQSGDPGHKIWSQWPYDGSLN